MASGWDLLGFTLGSTSTWPWCAPAEEFSTLPCFERHVNSLLHTWIPHCFPNPIFTLQKWKWGWENMINISPYLPLFPSLQISNWELHCTTPTFTTSLSTNETICKKEQLKVNLQDFIANFCSKNLKFMSNAPIISYLMITLNWAKIIIFMRVWLCPLNNHEAKTFYASYSSKWLTLNSWTLDPNNKQTYNTYWGMNWWSFTMTWLWTLPLLSFWFDACWLEVEHIQFANACGSLPLMRSLPVLCV